VHLMLPYQIRQLCFKQFLITSLMVCPGGLPAAWIARTAFPELGELLLRPGNKEMCGPLPANISYTVQYTSSTGAAFPLTGTLGSCAQACGSLTTSANTTNLFDISVEAQVRVQANCMHDASKFGALVVNATLIVSPSTVKVSLADLLQFNPSANVNGPVAPGTSLTRPCYSANEAPTYLGVQCQPFEPEWLSEFAICLCNDVELLNVVPVGSDACGVRPQVAILRMAKWLFSQPRSVAVQQGLQWHSRLPAHRRPAH
jgi:hypothetical protein